jgi:hypothetical protein
LFAPLLAEIEAVGTPLSTLMKANFDEEVDVPPKSRSKVVAYLGWIVPLCTFQLERLEPLEQVRMFDAVVRALQLAKDESPRVMEEESSLTAPFTSSSSPMKRSDAPSAMSTLVAEAANAL